ncbi:hypothetical protein C8R47DRAFT_1081340 [Mycena vitilis]|nr:hypothetical protein C8R47DRAFT_1081340 [Mycena vitilis]
MGRSDTSAPTVDPSDPASLRRYKRWRSSFEYNQQHRDARNTKKRERMAQARAGLKAKSPEVQAAYLQAKRESARKYREENRDLLARKARRARRRQRWTLRHVQQQADTAMWNEMVLLEEAVADLEPEDDAHMREVEEEEEMEEEEIFIFPGLGVLATRKQIVNVSHLTPPSSSRRHGSPLKLYLVCGRNVKHPGYYTSWPSADVEYSRVSGATCKGYYDLSELRSAWYRRCDQGEHAHPGIAGPSTSLPTTPNRHRNHAHSPPPPPCLPRPPRPPRPPRTPRTPRAAARPPRTQDPPRRVVFIESSPEPESPPVSPAGRLPAPATLPPPYSETQSAPRPLTCYGVRVGTEGEVFNDREEARNAYNLLHQQGREPGFLVASSLVACLSWIEASVIFRQQFGAIICRISSVTFYPYDDSDKATSSFMSERERKRRRGRTVYVNQPIEQQSVASSATNRRLHEVHHAAPPRSPVKGAHDNFDVLMGFVGADDDPPIESEGPAAIKVKKAKRYENSDRPLKTWIPLRDEYGDALMRLKGRGPWWIKGCTICNEANPSWRCSDCFGNRLLCTSCAINKHRDEPLHLLEEWQDGFFQPRTCRDLGLRYQLGHPAGEECGFVHLSSTRSKATAPKENGDQDKEKGFVVLHDNAIHVLDIDFCSCPGSPSEVDQLLNIGWFPATHKVPSTAATLSVLRRFHKLNLQARLPAYDFYNTLVVLTDASGCRKLPNRLPQFMTIVREYRHLKMCLRAGCVHDPEGIAGTKPGALAMPCRACPQPGVNLPVGWQDAPPEVGWIYRLLLSKDANFKMKGRDRSSRENDPTLGPGWAYMVANDDYLKFLSKHVKEDEINHCVSFAALWSANNKRAKGLRATGIGSVSCSRHEIFRARGTADLQKGERLIGTLLLTIIASYDIACQWGTNLWRRAKNMPAEMLLPDNIEILFKVPKFHLPPHVKRCHAPYSFNFTKWVGRTDGEGVERNWAWLNSAARSISVMGPGSREDTIDDLCGYSNWKKTKMVLAIPQAMLHSRAFHAFTDGLRDGHEEDLQKWETMVRTWEWDSDEPNPYEYVEVEALTMADVLQRISEEEHARVTRNGAAALQVKPGAFLIAGIEIQEDQAAVALEAKRTHRTTIQATSLQSSRTRLLGKVSKLHDIQDTYMPGLRTWIAQHIPALPTGTTAKPEGIPIYLPSSLPAAVRETVCVPGLVQQEDQLREAQAGGALRELRSGLRTRTFAHQFKRKHTSGQGMYTKTRSLLDGIEARIRSAADTYRAARTALFALRGPGVWEATFQELKKDDLRGMNERVMNDEEKEDNRKARLLAGLPADADADADEFGEPVELTVLFNLEVGEGRRSLSWIWYSGPVTQTDVTADGTLHEDIRVEWAKARARADRWQEELILLEEEMRRVLEFCSWKARWWEARVEPAARERKWEALWRAKWAAVRVRAGLVLRDHVVPVTEGVLVPLEVELDDENEEEAPDDDFDDDDDI